jgi:hypothetical protein
MFQVSRRIVGTGATPSGRGNDRSATTLRRAGERRAPVSTAGAGGIWHRAQQKAPGRRSSSDRAGAKKDPRLSTLVALADALGVTLDDLVGREPEAEQGPPKPRSRRKADQLVSDLGRALLNLFRASEEAGFSVAGTLAQPHELTVLSIVGLRIFLSRDDSDNQNPT